LVVCSRPSRDPCRGGVASAITEEPLIDALRRLGERTGELHRALAADPADPDFAPESISAADATAWEADTLTALAAVANDFQRQSRELPPTVQDVVARFLEAEPALRLRAAGFRTLVGLPKTRVHGDYHLGQTLRTVRDDWTILDFEGEPARPIAERRAKTSPLKDVAGMLRSFGYARGVARRDAAVTADLAAGGTAVLADWEIEARAAFLDGYRSGIAGAPALVPTDPAAFAAALAAWELDKALYEVHYEHSNRPDWLDLPLAALLADPTGSADGST